MEHLERVFSYQPNCNGSLFDNELTLYRPMFTSNKQKKSVDQTSCTSFTLFLSLNNEHEDNDMIHPTVSVVCANKKSSSFLRVPGRHKQQKKSEDGKLHYQEELKPRRANKSCYAPMDEVDCKRKDNKKNWLARTRRRRDEN